MGNYIEFDSEYIITIVYKNKISTSNVSAYQIYKESFY